MANPPQEEFFEWWCPEEKAFFFESTLTGEKFWAEYPDAPDIPEDMLVLYGAPPDQQKWHWWMPLGGPPNHGRQDMGGGGSEERTHDQEGCIPIPQIPCSRCRVPSICGSIPDVREAASTEVGDPVQAFLESLRGGQGQNAGPPPQLERREKTRRRWGLWMFGGFGAAVVLKIAAKLFG